MKPYHITEYIIISICFLGVCSELNSKPSLLTSGFVIARDQLILNCSQTNGKFAITNDGVNWEIIYSDLNYPVGNLTFFKGYYYASKDRAIFGKDFPKEDIYEYPLVRSKDLNNWEVVTEYHKSNIKDPLRLDKGDKSVTACIIFGLFSNNDYLYSIDPNELHRSPDGLHWEKVFVQPDTLALVAFQNFLGEIFLYNNGFRPPVGAKICGERTKAFDLNLCFSEEELFYESHDSLWFMNFMPTIVGEYAVFPTNESNTQSGIDYPVSFWVTKNGKELHEIICETDDVWLKPLNAVVENDSLFVYGKIRKLFNSTVIKFQVNFDSQKLEEISRTKIRHSWSNKFVNPWVIRFREKDLFIVGDKVLIQDEEEKYRTYRIN